MTLAMPARITAAAEYSISLLCLLTLLAGVAYGHGVGLSEAHYFNPNFKSSIRQQQSFPDGGVHAYDRTNSSQS